MEVLGDRPECPALDVSDLQLRLSGAEGELLNLPLPLRAPQASAPRWSRKRGELTLSFTATENAQPLLAEIPAFVAQLAERGWVVADGFLLGAEADAARRYVLGLHAEGRLSVGVGAHEGSAGSTDARVTKNDEYTFVEDAGPGGDPCADPLRCITRRANAMVAKLCRDGSVRELSGERLVAGHPMVSVYPGNGARYEKHYDSMSSGKGHNGRRLVVMVYLNPFWKASDGGCLRLLRDLHDEHGVADVAPLHGRMVGFLCEDRMPHQVLPCHATRVAVVLWYYNQDRLAARGTAGEDIKGFAFEGAT